MEELSGIETSATRLKRIERLREQGRFGEVPIRCEKDGAHRINVELGHEYAQTPRIRYFIRLNPGSELSIPQHHLGEVTSSSFTVYLESNRDGPIDGVLYWESLVLE
jgi:hypothetical protein